jgi:hypothetical protein
MNRLTRRSFIKSTAATAAVGSLGIHAGVALGNDPAEGERPKQDPRVKVVNPRGRVPLSFIIDDSTCLVNLNRFAIPQFAAAWKYERYHHDWRKMPVEIPDAFVRKFGEWCAQRDIKGKYSVVPYPACVGRVDRELPGWTSKELAASLDLVRKLMLPNWDIHSEMVTHTRVIDTKTGHPIPKFGLEYMENWRWADGKSVDELADYLSYSLRILKNVGLPCEGVTTPGGFGGRVRAELSQAALQSVRDVFGAEVPHYFKYVTASGEASVQPRVEFASGLNGNDPKCLVSLIACTGDWTGGWDCSNRGDVDRFITADLNKGRMVEVIDRGEPALMLCHWTGIYFSGEEVGFKIFQEAVRRMHSKYDNLLWMKLSEIARYWAAKELTEITNNNNRVQFKAPFAADAFTVQVETESRSAPKVVAGRKQSQLVEVSALLKLKPGTFFRAGKSVTVCFDLPRGESELVP